MAINLLDLLSRAISPALTKSVSNSLGEPESAVQSGIALLLPALLGGLALKASSPAGASGVFAQLTGAQVDSGLLGSIGSMLGSGQSRSVTSVGSALLAALFGGDKTAGIGAALAGITGMKPGNATSLAALAAPLVFGWLKQMIVDRKLDARGTAALLTGQKEHLAGQLDPALTAAFGLGSPASLLAGLAPAATASSATIGSAAVAGSSAAAAAGASRWLPWLIALLAAIGLLWYFFGMGTKPPATPAVTVAPAATFDLKVPAKIYFGTGKAGIGSEGSAAIKSVATLLDAQKSLKVDITGYTDKTGDSATNQELAKNRALAVQAALVANGVAADRIEARPPIFVELGVGGADAEARRVEISAR